MNTLFEKYTVQLREHTESVTSVRTGELVTLTPQQLAVFETATKANYIMHFVIAAGHDDMSEMAGVVLFHQAIADEAGFHLPWISDEQAAQGWQDAAKDFARCAEWLAEAGLYYDLLD